MLCPYIGRHVLSMSISPSEKEVLLRIYIGQNIREEGILQSGISQKEEIKTLLSKNLIKENHWYLDQFLTSHEGSALAKKLVMERIAETQGQLQHRIQHIPKRILGFFIQRYISKRLVFSTQKPSLSDSWEDRILTDGRIWVMWNEMWSVLESLGFSVRAYSYVSSRGGELRDLCYVISSEVKESLVTRHLAFDFAPEEESRLNLYPVVATGSRIVTSMNVDEARQGFLQLLKDHSVDETQVAEIINEMSRDKITSEYRGLLSENKPFDVADQRRLQTYLDMTIIEPATKTLLGSAQAKGFLAVCKEDTEQECLDRMLFGSRRDWFDRVREVRKGDMGFLLNLDTDVLHGVFKAESEGTMNIVPDAWGGRFPAQVKVSWEKRYEGIANARQLLSDLGVPHFRFILTSKEATSVCALFEAPEKFGMVTVVRRRGAPQERIITTEDGHNVRSKAECMIDDWLYRHDLLHAYELPLPREPDLTCDFYVPKADCYIEYWGLEDDEQYLKRKEKKVNIYQKHGLNLISLNEKDVQRLRYILRKELLRYLPKDYVLH